MKSSRFFASLRKDKWKIEVVNIDGFSHYQATSRDGTVLTSTTFAGIYNLINKKEKEEQK